DAAGLGRAGAAVPPVPVRAGRGVRPAGAGRNLARAHHRSAQRLLHPARHADRRRAGDHRLAGDAGDLSAAHAASFFSTAFSVCRKPFDSCAVSSGVSRPPTTGSRSWILEVQVTTVPSAAASRVMLPPSCFTGGNDLT